MSQQLRGRRWPFAAPEVVVMKRPDGVSVLRSPQRLAGYPRALGVHLEHWARTAPDRAFLKERGPGGQWRGPTYAEARESVWRIATWLLRAELSSDRPVMILSDNNIDQALLTLAAMQVGIPVVPVSPAYSLLSRDHGRLLGILDQISPGVVYVADHRRCARALAALRTRSNALVVSGTPAERPADLVAFEQLTHELDTARVDERFRSVGPATVAKLLFTSGSTGAPKGVINTQQMLCSNQQAKAQVWPFLSAEPPVLVDWLPWSHTFGGNHNFNLVLRHGGTLYIDAGRPAPGPVDTPLANLREIAPTIYFNVPRGYGMLVTALERDAAFRRQFFSRLRLVFYAAAALPPHLWDALGQLATDATGDPIPVCSAWGTTETAPMATECHYQADRAGVIGLPVPGTEIKLVPIGERREIRVRGPNVTPGFWRRPDLTAAHFDAEGFCLTGDAVRFVDETQPERGLVFDGRLVEDFKLDSGTWVYVGQLRVLALAMLAPVAQDIVVTGHDRGEVGFLVFPNIPACRALAASLAADAPIQQVLDHPAVGAVIRDGLSRLRDRGAGSSTFATRAMFLTEAPSIDRGELTDKGQINQGAVLSHRSHLVEALYAAVPGAGVIALPPRDLWQ